jgi:hypothetical protein
MAGEVEGLGEQSLESGGRSAGEPAESKASASICRAGHGFVANVVPAGTPAAAHRLGSVVHEPGR